MGNVPSSSLRSFVALRRQWGHSSERGVSPYLKTVPMAPLTFLNYAVVLVFLIVRIGLNVGFFMIVTAVTSSGLFRPYIKLYFLVTIS